eukprot:760129-Hanusia_phi.AAC.6
MKASEAGHTAASAAPPPAAAPALTRGPVRTAAGGSCDPDPTQYAGSCQTVGPATQLSTPGHPGCRQCHLARPRGGPADSDG